MWRGAHRDRKGRFYDPVWFALAAGRSTSTLEGNNGPRLSSRVPADSRCLVGCRCRYCSLLGSKFRQLDYSRVAHLRILDHVGLFVADSLLMRRDNRLSQVWRRDLPAIGDSGVLPFGAIGVFINAPTRHAFVIAQPSNQRFARFAVLIPESGRC
jgi:hypothetical protein